MIASLKKVNEKIQAHIMDEMGNASIGRTGDWIVQWKMRSIRHNQKR